MSPARVHALWHFHPHSIASWQPTFLFLTAPHVSLDTHSLYSHLLPNKTHSYCFVRLTCSAAGLLLCALLECRTDANETRREAERAEGFEKTHRIARPRASLPGIGGRSICSAYLVHFRPQQPPARTRRRRTAVNQLRAPDAGCTHTNRRQTKGCVLSEQVTARLCPPASAVLHFLSLYHIHAPLTLSSSIPTTCRHSAASPHLIRRTGPSQKRLA